MTNSLAIAICWVALGRAESPALKLYEAVEPHMGTLFQIKVYSTDQDLAKHAFESAFARVADLDNKLSDYKLDSELNLATRAAVLHPVRVSDDLATVLIAAQGLSEKTGGAFDITVGPLTKLWRQARKDHAVPSPEAIRQAREKCGYHKLHFDHATKNITVDSADVQLDLGAIAKGYAADEALTVLSRLGIRRALVAASGDLALGDPPPGESGWKIGIDASDRTLVLANAAVSTSGASEQALEVNGKRYSHIIDPATGMGLSHDITVTTIARHGLLADPAATAISVLGCSRGRTFIESTPGLEAYITERINGQVHSLHAGNR